MCVCVCVCVCVCRGDHHKATAHRAETHFREHLVGISGSDCEDAPAQLRQGLFWIADKYQIAPLARSGSTVLSMLRIFGHVRHANGEYQDAFARVMQMVSKDEELLRVVCTTVSELSCDGTKTETCRSVDSAQASNSPETML